MHTRPDGDLENLAIEKGNFIDLKIALLHSASHWVLDMDALTCLTSCMHSVPCSFHLDSTYALTFTSGCNIYCSVLHVTSNSNICIYIYIYAYTYHINGPEIFFRKG